MGLPLTLLDILVVVAFVVFVTGLKSYARSLPLPPGPKRLPLIGNILNAPKSYAWVQYHKWCRELGTDILYLDMMGQSIIILDSHTAADDLFNKRSSMYSSRPHSWFLVDLMKVTSITALLEYGKTWRQQRRVAQPFFGTNVPGTYKPHVRQAVYRLLGRLLEKPKDIQTELRYMTGESILSACYGADARTEEGIRDMKNASKATEIVTEALLPGRFLVDFVPALRFVPEWMPGAGFQKKAREYGQFVHDVYIMPFDTVKRNMAAGSCTPCFVSSALQSAEAEQELDDEAEDNIRGVAGSLYGAGTDSTSNAIASAILGLLSRPDVLRRARSDLDRVIEPGRLPDFTDEPSLPFITAIAKETLRWRQVTPLGIPHVTDTEDDYKGYRIPAGSILFANQWAILQDEQDYDEPLIFKPERFMKGDEFNTEVKDPETVYWGLGRRTCVGRHMAFSTIWITLASLIYVFDIEKEVDEHGCIIEPNPEYTSTIVFGPGPFPCSIRPRCEEFAGVVQAYAGNRH